MEAPELQQLAPLAVPFVLYLVKWFFENVVPDSIVVKIRDELVPMLAPIAGVLVQSAATGQVDFTAGATAGLAGVGLHQALKQIGIIKRN